MGYSCIFRGFLFVVAASCAGCAENSACACPVVGPTISPSERPSPIGASATIALPAAGSLVTFPAYLGASGELALPPYAGPPGTTATLTTTLASGAGSAPESRRRSDAGTTQPAIVMALQMTFSQNVTLSQLPITVFAPPAGSPTTGYAAELFDVQTATLVTAAAQAHAPSGAIAFSPFGPTGAIENGTIALTGGREYALELVLHSALTLPAAGLACGPPPPVAAIPLDLAYPEPSSTGVPTSIGEVLLQGGIAGYFGPTTVSIASASGSMVVSAATPVPAPSPLPSPIATPVSGTPYFEVPLPRLSPLTQYVVTKLSYNYANVPPLCVSSGTSTLGTFTTGA